MDSPALIHTIKWKDHKKEIIEEQKYLFNSHLESDCTLISAQGVRIQSHQIILSSSSEFFRKILSELPISVEAPTIHIPDVDTSVLEAVLKFIYTGECNIASSYLTSLLEICNFLDIKGCVANGFTLNGTALKVSGGDENVVNKPYNSSIDSWSCEEYMVVTQSESVNSEEESIEPDYLEEYLEDEAIIKEEQLLMENEDDEDRQEENEFISFEFEKEVEDSSSILTKDGTDNPESSIKRQRNMNRQGVRSTSSQIDKALNEVNNGKTIHRLSVEYNLPRSTLYHRFRNNENLKQNYRLERKSALDSAIQAVLNERLSLKMAADKYKIPKTAIWREVRKFDQYQPSNKEVTAERQNAQREILSGKSLTSISAKYGNYNCFWVISISLTNLKCQSKS